MTTAGAIISWWFGKGGFNVDVNVSGDGGVDDSNLCMVAPVSPLDLRITMHQALESFDFVSLGVTGNSVGRFQQGERGNWGCQDGV